MYEADIEPLTNGDALLFAHGFNIRFGADHPPEGWTWPWSPSRALATRAPHPPRVAACPA